MTTDPIRARIAWRDAIVAVAMRRGIDPADVLPEANRRLRGAYAHRVLIAGAILRRRWNRWCRVRPMSHVEAQRPLPARSVAEMRARLAERMASR